AERGATERAQNDVHLFRPDLEQAADDRLRLLVQVRRTHELELPLEVRHAYAGVVERVAHRDVRPPRNAVQQKSPLPPPARGLPDRNGGRRDGHGADLTPKARPAPSLVVKARPCAFPTDFWRLCWPRPPSGLRRALVAARGSARRRRRSSRPTSSTP